MWYIGINITYVMLIYNLYYILSHMLIPINISLHIISWSLSLSNVPDKTQR